MGELSGSYFIQEVIPWLSPDQRNFLLGKSDGKRVANLTLWVGGIAHRGVAHRGVDPRTRKRHAARR